MKSAFQSLVFSEYLKPGDDFYYLGLFLVKRPTTHSESQLAALCLAKQLTELPNRSTESTVTLRQIDWWKIQIDRTNASSVHPIIAALGSNESVLEAADDWLDWLSTQIHQSQDPSEQQAEQQIATATHSLGKFLCTVTLLPYEEAQLATVYWLVSNGRHWRNEPLRNWQTQNRPFLLDIVSSQPNLEKTPISHAISKVYRGFITGWFRLNKHISTHPELQYELSALNKLFRYWWLR